MSTSKIEGLNSRWLRSALYHTIIIVTAPAGNVCTDIITVHISSSLGMWYWRRL